jgi:hypothetical protein
MNAAHLMHAVSVEIDSCDLRFETDCTEALERLEDMCRSTFVGGFYRYSITRSDGPGGAPIFRYLDRSVYRTTYRELEDLCIFEAPWTDISRSTLLAVWLHFLAELVRQRRGEYLLHASAVARGGRAIVLFGPAESGKTICALDLCLRRGFQLFANNRIRATVRDGCVHLLEGDARFNLRFSSLWKYSESLCRSVFPDPPELEPRCEKKKLIEPASLGIQVAAPLPRVAAFVWIKLDADDHNASTDEISPVISSHEEFWAKADLYQEMSALIRGVKFIPLVESRGFQEIFVPSLDTPELVSGRVSFLSTLFATARVARMRASLATSLDAIERLFGSVSSQDHPDRPHLPSP